jgi:hypothetical protein
MCSQGENSRRSTCALRKGSQLLDENSSTSCSRYSFSCEIIRPIIGQVVKIPRDVFAARSLERQTDGSPSERGQILTINH